MNAALSKGKETVEFVWDSSHALSIVMVYCYDYSQTPRADAYAVQSETTEYARRYWQGLVESGFRRVTPEQAYDKFHHDR